MTSSADSPLIHNVTTPIERNHLAYTTRLVHQSDFVMSLKLLESGTAKDVSGVLRISRGAFAGTDIDENEFLYFVGGDGNVKVFARGSSMQ